MYKKTISGFLLLLFLGLSAFAYVTLDFPGWRALVQKSSDIFIGRCNLTPDPFNVWKDGHQVDFRGLVESDLKIISVLKGTSNSVAAHIVSAYWPRQGEYYLIFASYRDGAYQALEDYHFVPLGAHFLTNGLTGKTFDEKVQMLLQRRLDGLNHQMKDEKVEKQRLEEGLGK